MGTLEWLLENHVTPSQSIDVIAFSSGTIKDLSTLKWHMIVGGMTAQEILDKREAIDPIDAAYWSDLLSKRVEGLGTAPYMGRPTALLIYVEDP